MPFVSLDELTIHYLHHGAPANRETLDTSTGHHDGVTRSPLLMLAGMASDCMSWQPVIAHLADTHELIVPDNRCTGRSHPAVLPSSRDLMVADSIALLDQLGIERVSILGHSMGGMLGCAIAAHAPSRVDRLIVASTLPQVSHARTALFDALLALRKNADETQWFSLLFQFLFSARFFDDENEVSLATSAACNYPYKQSLNAFARQVEALHSFKAPVALWKLRCPVTLITGESDVLTTPRMLDEFAQGSEGQTLDLDVDCIPDAAHALHWEQPEAFSAAVNRALH